MNRLEAGQTRAGESGTMTAETMACKKLSEYQTEALENNFKVTRFPDGMSLMLIAAECGLSEEQTQQWFKQRNAKWRQAEGLPAERGSVLD